MNKALISGRLARDPEVKYGASGMAFAKFTVACKDRRKDKDGNWQDVTEWVPCSVFGKTAEYVQQNCKKGSYVAIEGEFHTSNYEKDGQKMRYSDVLVKSIDCPEKSSNGGGQQSQYRPTPQRNYQMPQQAEDVDAAPF